MKELWICSSYIEENGQDAIIMFPRPTLARLVCQDQFCNVQPHVSHCLCSVVGVLHQPRMFSALKLALNILYVTLWCRGKRSKQCKHWCIADAEEPKSERRQSWSKLIELMKWTFDLQKSCYVSCYLYNTHTHLAGVNPLTGFQERHHEHLQRCWMSDLANCGDQEYCVDDMSWICFISFGIFPPTFFLSGAKEDYWQLDHDFSRSHGGWVKSVIVFYALGEFNGLLGEA